MSTVAGRKKSFIGGSNGIPAIEIPLQTNTLLNKSGYQSTSLYQQCSQLRQKLMRIPEFRSYLQLELPADDSLGPRKSRDMVTDLWQHLQLGIPLVFLFNLLPAATPIEIETDPHLIELDRLAKKDRQRAIAQVSIGINRLQKQGDFSPEFNFTVGDLLNNNTDGFVKVVQSLTHLVNRLPPSVFSDDPAPPSPSFNASQTSLRSGVDEESEVPQEVGRKNHIRELVETERKYVQELEIMQSYASALLQNDIIDQDTIHHLFPGLNKLLDFQRKFLIQMEQTAEHSWKEQAWGSLFTNNEEGFEVYEPYAVNYTNATELMLAEEQNLMTLAHVIEPKHELPAFLIKPIQRICRYPLLLEPILKKSNPAEYPLYDDLQQGCLVVKRITTKINEAQRRSENSQTVKLLEARVEDWKGHNLANFGELLLDDIFSVTKSEVDREYHVFLFEKIILCCKEAVPNYPGGKRGTKNSSILKKQSMPPLPSPGGSGLNRKKTTPLLLKGRIFLNNVTKANRINLPTGDPYLLRVYWRGDDDTEYFTLRCRTDEQLKQWETAIAKLIETSHMRRQSERSGRGTPNSSNPALTRFSSTTSATHYDRSMSITAGGYSNGRYPPGYKPESKYSSDFKVPSHPYPSTQMGGPGPYSAGAPPVTRPPNDSYMDYGDEYDDYPQVSSGRGTPLGGRRAGELQSMPPERDMVPPYDRPRAKTEDASGAILQHWRNHGHPIPAPPPPPIGALPAAPLGVRSMAGPRMERTGSDASFGSNMSHQRGAPAPQLRSKFSTTKLRNPPTAEDEQSGYPRNGSAVSLVSSANGAPMTRARSSSTPSAYIPQKSVPPPLPTTSAHWNPKHDGRTKRSSGSSESTGESSDLSHSQTVSPITPFGSNDSSLATSSLRSARSQVFTGGQRDTAQLRRPVRVKVRFGEDIFEIHVEREIDYYDLVEKVGKKIRLCGGRRGSGPLRVRYQDEDGDFVSLTTDEDVQLAFEMSNGALTLFVS